MKLRNISPLGPLDVPGLGLVLEPGGEFEVDDKVGASLLEQVGNFEQVDTKEKVK